jgi:hypothetical protein
VHSQFAACVVDSPCLHQFQAQSAFSKAFMQRNPGFAWDVELELFATLASKSLSCFPQPELQSLSLSLSLSLLPICKRQDQPSSLLSADRSRESLIRNRWQRCVFVFPLSSSHQSRVRYLLLFALCVVVLNLCGFRKTSIFCCR